MAIRNLAFPNPPNAIFHWVEHKLPSFAKDPGDVIIIYKHSLEEDPPKDDADPWKRLPLDEPYFFVPIFPYEDLCESLHIMWEAAIALSKEEHHPTTTLHVVQGFAKVGFFTSHSLSEEDRFNCPKGRYERLQEF